jgi:hypothetical protein
MKNLLNLLTFEFFSWVISTLLVLTGSVVSLSLIAIIIPNSREKPFTPPRVFSTSENA